jgi:hypothetical protein
LVPPNPELEPANSWPVSILAEETHRVKHFCDRFVTASG